MAASSEMVDNLECPICKDLLNEPKILFCSHTFCKECLVYLHRSQSSGDIITCAVCRTPSTLPNNDVCHLPCNQIAKNLVEALRKEQSKCAPGSPTETCDQCDGDVQNCSVCADKGFARADVYCQRCAQFMCQSCLEQHNKFQGNKTHEIVRMESIEYGSVRVQSVCAEHPEELERYVCITCRVFTCFKCRIVNHESTEGHEVFDVDDYEESQKVETAILQSKAYDRIGVLDKHITSVEQQRQNVSQAIDQVKQDIMESYDAAVARLTNERDELLRECLQEEESMSQELQDIADQVQRKRETVVEKTSAVCDGLSAFMRGQTFPDASLSTDLNAVLDSDEEEADELSMQVYSRAMSVTFVQGNGEIRDGEATLGELNFT